MATQKVERTVTVSEDTPPVQQTTPVSNKTANYSAIDQLVYLIFGMIEVLLLIRFAFRLFGASPAAGIVSLVYGITNVLMVPFQFIFPTNQVEGAVFEWSVLVAILFYALIAWVIMKLIRIIYTADN